MALVWTNDLATGVAWQDKEHKELFRFLDELVEAAARDAGKGALESAVASVDDYVVTHFHHEEKAMSRYNYPEALKHLEAHTYFIDDFSHIKEEYLLKGVLDGEKLARIVVEKVVGWWREHIITIDKPLGAFLVSRHGEKGP